MKEWVKEGEGRGEGGNREGVKEERGGVKEGTGRG